MAVLPDKILEDFEIDAFINRVNSSAEKIISDPKFKLTTTNIPGFSLLLKLQIRVFEKSLASSFAPIFLGKEALSGGFKKLGEAFGGIKTIFTNPIQFILDEGINGPLEEFPIPIRFDIGGGSSSNSNIPDSDGRDFFTFRNFSYSGLFESTQKPEPGQYSTPQDSIADLREVTISRLTNNGEINPLLDGIKIGDQVQISDGIFLGTYVVNTVEVVGESESLNMDLTVISVQNLSTKDEDGSTTIPGFNQSSVGINGCQLAIQNFLDPSGSLSIPLRSIGVNIPFISDLILSIGDFSKLKDSSPSKKYVDRLSQETGLEFQDVLSGILSGKFPSLDFKKLQEDTSAGIDGSEEQGKENLVVLARFIEIAATNPCFLITIIINYLKLLLLPLRVVVGVIKGLASSITNPVKLLKTVIKGLTDPIGLVCDLVAKGFLEVIRPYIQSPISFINLTWEEALVDPKDPKRGLQPLISDMVCGDFSRKLKNYQPSQSFFNSLSNSLPSEDTESQDQGPKITYDLVVNEEIPSEGQVSINSLDSSKITIFRISSLSNTVEDALPYLAYLSVGDEFNFQYLEQSGKYRVSTKRFISSGELPYFEMFVSPLPNVLKEAENKSPTELILDGIDINDLKASLSVDNPDKEFLFIIEKYLPVKMVAVWESIKGIIALFGGLAQQVPSLIPAVLRSLFGLNAGKSKAEILAAVDEDANFSNSLVEASNEVINLIYRPSTTSMSYQATRNYNGNYSPGNRTALFDIVQNSNSSTEPGIETIFYDLYDALESEGKTPAIIKNQLSSSPGEITKNNAFLNIRISSDDKYAFPLRSPSKYDFYFGEYNLKDVGDSVKVMTQVILLLRDREYFDDKSKVQLEKVRVLVYKNSDDGKRRVVMFDGNARDALNKYNFTTMGFDKKESPRLVRTKINREMDFLMNYGLPSLLT